MGLVVPLLSWLALTATAVEHDATHAPSPCQGPDADPWVADFRQRVVSFSGLYEFAVGLLGTPLDCHGDITSEFDGALFGTVVFTFTGGATFTVETMPIETSVTTLRAPEGFADPEELRAVLAAETSDIGLDVDWSEPEISADGGEAVHIFRDPSPGLNGSAAIVFAGEVLVAVRIALAP